MADSGRTVFSATGSAITGGFSYAYIHLFGSEDLALPGGSTLVPFGSFDTIDASDINGDPTWGTATVDGKINLTIPGLYWVSLTARFSGGTAPNSERLARITGTAEPIYMHAVAISAGTSRISISQPVAVDPQVGVGINVAAAFSSTDAADVVPFADLTVYRVI